MMETNPCNLSLPPQERTDEHFIERHAYFLKLIQETKIRLLFLGDSITRRWVDNLHLWDQYFGLYQPANFGVGGDVVESLLWRIQNGEIDNIQPEAIILLIGTNNIPTHSASSISTTIRQIVATIQEKQPNTKIILMAIFPRGPQERSKANQNNPYYMDIINAVNRDLASLDNQDSIQFFDIGSDFLRSDGEIDTSLMPDQLHIIEPGYQIWGETLVDFLEWLMKPIP